VTCNSEDLLRRVQNNFGPDSYYEASIPDIMISNSISTVLESKFKFYTQMYSKLSIMGQTAASV